MVENDEPHTLELLEAVYPLAGRSKIIGITGSPGVGKSSVINELIREFRSKQKTVAVIAVDPTSPFSGGSVLGDRVRLSDHYGDEGVFIRSLSTRGQLGGLTRTIRQTVHLVDAFGFDQILLETVGVGQNETEIRDIAHNTCLVLGPDSGDEIQMIKAGVLEIAQVFVVNKKDKPGAEELATELRHMISDSKNSERQVLQTSIKDRGSFTALASTLDSLKVRANYLTINNQALVESVYIGFALKQLREELRNKKLTSENPYTQLKGLVKRYFGSSL